MAVQSKLELFHYVIVHDDGQECDLDAVGDDQAIGLSQKQYPDGSWKLFRLNSGLRVPVCLEAPECSE